MFVARTDACTLEPQAKLNGETMRDEIGTSQLELSLILAMLPSQ